MWTYNSPNFINGNIFCFNKNNMIYAWCNESTGSSAVRCNIVAIYIALYSKSLNPTPHIFM